MKPRPRFPHARAVNLALSRPGMLLHAVAALNLLLISCASIPKKDVKAEAQQHWSEVRARVKTQLAAQQYAGGLFDECIKSASEATALDPKSIDGYILAARANLEISRFASAQLSIDAAMANAATAPELTYLQGVILEQRGEFESALQAFRDVLLRDPSHIDALMAAAEILVQLDRVAEARTLLADHAHRIDDNGSFSLLAARLARVSGDQDEAFQRYLEASGFLSHDGKVTEELGLFLAELRRWTEAESVLAPLVESDPLNASSLAVLALAACRLENRNSAAARTILVPYATRHPDDAAAQLLLAKAALAQADWPQAHEAVGQAQARLPHDPEVRFVRALVDWKRGSNEAARSAALQLLRERPHDPDTLCLLGELASERGETSTATEQFRLALEISPASPWARTGLARIGGSSVAP